MVDEKILNITHLRHIVRTYLEKKEEGPTILEVGQSLNVLDVNQGLGVEDPHFMWFSREALCRFKMIIIKNVYYSAVCHAPQQTQIREALLKQRQCFIF